MRADPDLDGLTQQRTFTVPGCGGMMGPRATYRLGVLSSGSAHMADCCSGPISRLAQCRSVPLGSCSLGHAWGTSGLDLFVPKPARRVSCLPRCLAGLRLSVRRRPLLSAAAAAHRYSVGYSSQPGTQDNDQVNDQRCDTCGRPLSTHDRSVPARAAVLVS
jgi:hypothetical protein